jgi:superfamily II DNA or RNA helicase
MLDGLRLVPIIGLSATPMRKGMGRYFDTLVRGPCIPTLIETGYLVPAKAFAPNHAEMRELLRRVKVKAGYYSEKQLERALNQKIIIGDVVRSWKKPGENRQAIVFGVTMAHCRELADYFLAEGIYSAGRAGPAAIPRENRCPDIGSCREYESLQATGLRNAWS